MNNSTIEFMYFGSMDDINTTVELNPFFIPEQVYSAASYTVVTAAWCLIKQELAIIILHSN